MGIESCLTFFAVLLRYMMHYNWKEKRNRKRKIYNSGQLLKIESRDSKTSRVTYLSGGPVCKLSQLVAVRCSRRTAFLLSSQLFLSCSFFLGLCS